MVRFSVQQGDVRTVDADVLLLKFARWLYGVDSFVVSLLEQAGVCHAAEVSPGVDEACVISPQGALAARRVLFLGTPPLSVLTYERIRDFCRRAIAVLDEERIPAGTLATTIHGPGYGLDPIEAFQYMLEGFRTELPLHRLPLREIIFVERRPSLAGLLKAALEGATEAPLFAALRSSDAVTIRGSELPVTPPPRTQSKEHVFVAMPYSEEFEDVYEFGILSPVRACGYICEKVGEVPFTGDILQRIRDGIRSARFVIADLSQARPNVYLEVGYAWGCGKKVILIARQGEQPHFDVAAHHTIFYSTIKQLAGQLTVMIEQVFPHGGAGKD